MKQVSLTLILLALMLCSSYAQNKAQDNFFLTDAPGKVLAGLNEIPDWVRDRVSDKEYNTLKGASSYFKIDYTFLYRNNETGFRNKVFADLRKAISDIKAGNYNDSTGLGPIYGHVGFMSICQHVDNSREWILKSYTRISDNLFFAGKHTRIYMDASQDAGVEINVWYIHDKGTKETDIIHTTVSEIGTKAVVCNPENEKHSIHCYYDKKTGEIVARTAGTLEYHTGDGKNLSTDYNGAIGFRPELD